MGLGNSERLLEGYSVATVDSQKLFADFVSLQLKEEGARSVSFAPHQMAEEFFRAYSPTSNRIDAVVAGLGLLHEGLALARTVQRVTQEQNLPTPAFILLSSSIGEGHEIIERAKRSGLIHGFVDRTLRPSQPVLADLPMRVLEGIVAVNCRPEPFVPQPPIS